MLTNYVHGDPGASL